MAKSNVDERIVEMRFDNKEFESGIKTSLNSLENLKKGLDLEESAKKLTNLGNATKGLNLGPISTAVETVADRFSTLGIIGVTALQNITNSVINTGKKMLDSLTIAPVREGFEEYELKMGSVQTIMNGTGESLETVMKYLEELNTYADKTIYSFADMTSNIGKFTNAGVNLDSAVKAIKGVSNEAAISGANANEASRAMYNFAQALSAGYVKLIDWKSIENANMATVEFKQQLLDTALALGTVVKEGDKYRTTTTDLNGKVSDLFTATSNFNESLSNQWMTTDVLVETLGRYADETTEIGDKAYRAAQEVKTFSQLMDTLKEAVGSGWAQTWEIVFGNFNEAKELWTTVSDVVGGFIDRQSEARNTILQEWKDLGGRAALLNSFGNALKFVGDMLKPIGKAWNKAFPSEGKGKRLTNLSKSLEIFTQKLTVSGDTADRLYRTFHGLFSVFGLISDIAGGAAKTSLRLLTTVLFKLFGISDKSILSLTARLGDLAVKMRAFVKEHNFVTKGLEKLADGAIIASKYFGEFLKYIYNLPVVQKAISNFGDGLKQLGQDIEYYSHQGFVFVTEFIDRVRQMDRITFKGVLDLVKEFSKRIRNYISDAGWSIDNIKDRFEMLKEKIRDFVDNSSANLDTLKGKLLFFL